MSQIFLTNESPELRRLWHPIGRVESFEGGPSRVELIGEGFAIARIDGHIRAFRDVCPHRFARISDGRIIADAIECPYHGWQFDSAGTCAHIPSLGSDATLPQVGLDSVHVKEQYGLVWIAPEEPLTDVLDIPEWENPALERVLMPPVDIRAAASQAIDNFLDFAHFPFVHAGTFGSDDDRVIGDFTTSKAEDGWGFTVEYEHLIDNHEDPLVHTGRHPLTQPRRMRYDYRIPFSANLNLELPVTGMLNSIVMWCQPIAMEHTRVHMLMLRNDCGSDDAKEAAVEYEMRIFREDLRIIERLANTTLPLDRGQAHVRSDRHTVEYRRVLRRLFD